MNKKLSNISRVFLLIQPDFFSEGKRLFHIFAETTNKEMNKYIWVYRVGIEKFKYKNTPEIQILKLDHKSLDNFEPSAISISPDGSIYILSSATKTLLTLKPSGKIKRIVDLKKSIFAQPEGITFDSSGIAFISNEKRKRTANILEFSPK